MRQQRWQRLAQIRQLLLDGRSRAEIATALAISQRSVDRDVAAIELQAPHGNAGRLVAANIRKSQLARLDALAASAGCDRQEMASRLILAALEAGPGGAERLLGRYGRPTGRYRNRRARVHAKDPETPPAGFLGPGNS